MATALHKAHYNLQESIQNTYPVDFIDDGDFVKLKVARTCYRSFPILKVLMWVRLVDEIYSKNNTTAQKVDLVAAMPGATSAHVLETYFDIEICKALWDGVIFRWSSVTSPHVTCAFQWMSGLCPLTHALVTGFIQGWERGNVHVDACLTQS